MNDQERHPTGDTFDRIYASLADLPDHEFSTPSTVTSALPFIGRVQTYVVQTARTPEGKYVCFVQMVDAEGRARIVIPAKVMDRLYRQREQLVTRARRETGKRIAAERKRELRVAE